MTSDPRPIPDSGWSTVCFRAARSGGTHRRGGSPAPALSHDGSHERSSLLVWRSDTAHGEVLVRSDPLSPSTGDRGHPYPVPCAHGPNGPFPCDVHLWVDADSPARAELVMHADVLVSREPLPTGAARRRVRALLDGRPGCLAAAVPDTATTCVVGVRERTGAVSFVRPTRGRADAPPPHAVVSVVHAWTVSGRSPGALLSLAPVPSR